MKVLWLAIDRSKRVANHFDNFRRAFGNVASVTSLIHKSQDCHPFELAKQYLSGRPYPHLLRKHLEKHPDYDVIICDAIFMYMLEDWDKIDIPVVLIIEDMHSNDPNDRLNWKSLALKYGFHIMHRYQFRKFFTDIPDKLKTHWSPHSINTSIFNNYSCEKDKGLLQTGAVYKIYRTRNTVSNELNGSPFFNRIVRPIEYSDKPWPVGKEYAKQLNSAHMCLCCGADVQYPVRKYFEIPACASVIYGDYFDELGDLGFEPDKNMIQVDLKNIKSQVTNILSDKDKLQEIAYNGYRLINERHTDEIRTLELKQWLQKEVI